MAWFINTFARLIIAGWLGAPYFLLWLWQGYRPLANLDRTAAYAFATSCVLAVIIAATVENAGIVFGVCAFAHAVFGAVHGLSWWQTRKQVLLRRAQAANEATHVNDAPITAAEIAHVVQAANDAGFRTSQSSTPAKPMTVGPLNVIVACALSFIVMLVAAMTTSSLAGRWVLGSIAASAWVVAAFAVWRLRAERALKERIERAYRSLPEPPARVRVEVGAEGTYRVAPPSEREEAVPSEEELVPWYRRAFVRRTSDA